MAKPAKRSPERKLQVVLSVRVRVAWSCRRHERADAPGGMLATPWRTGRYGENNWT